MSGNADNVDLHDLCEYVMCSSLRNAATPICMICAIMSGNAEGSLLQVLPGTWANGYLVFLSQAALGCV